MGYVTITFVRQRTRKRSNNETKKRFELLLLTGSLEAQSPPAAFANLGLTDYPVFRFFLKHVDQMYSRSKVTISGGKISVSQEWVAFQTASGLDEKELSFLVQEAQDCENDIAEFDAAAQKWRKEYPPGPLPAAAATQQSALSVQRQQIVQNHINSLKGFFVDKWAQVYTLAWNTDAPHIQLIKPAIPGSVTPPLSSQKKGANNQ